MPPDFSAVWQFERSTQVTRTTKPGFLKQLLNGRYSKIPTYEHTDYGYRDHARVRLDSSPAHTQKAAEETRQHCLKSQSTQRGSGDD